MKKIVYYIAVAFLAINFSSCSDFLDLPSKSKTDSESAEFNLQMQQNSD